MLTTSKKLSTVAVAVLFGILSIYATSFMFTSTNHTAYQENATLNMRSGAQIPVVMAPGQTVPTNINNDAVVGVSIFGAFVPAGANMVVPSPNGNVQIIWQMAGGAAVGFGTMPGGGELS